MSKMRVTIDQVMSWGPCGYNGDDDGRNYTRARVTGLFGRRKYMTALQILALDIPVEDRLWAVLRVDLVDARTLRLLACDCAERALMRERKRGRELDQRSWDAVAVSRRYAMGKATNRELVAAWAAASDAASAAASVAASDAAWTAAWAAASAAAWAAASDAARTAARTAERKWQVRHLVEMLVTP